MEDIVVGIDFGTTNTSVSYMKYNNTWSNFSPECFDLDRSTTIRTLITYKDDNQFWIGNDALKYSAEYPEGFIDSIKKRVINDTLKEVTGSRAKSELDIVSDFFSKILEKIEPQVTSGTRIKGVAIGIPVGFKDQDKDLYLRAMVKSGFYKNHESAIRNTIFVSEPIAAVLNYNVSLKDDKRVMVFDFGGGTLDLVVMDLKNMKDKNEIKAHDVMAKEGNQKLGGDDFDKAILENIVVEKFGVRNLKNKLGINQLKDILTVQEGIELMSQIRQAKEELTQYDVSTIAFEKGTLKMNIEITREEYELAISSYLGDIKTLVQDCLANAALSSSDIDLVVLSGGSALTPVVRQLLGDIFGRDKIKVDGDAMTSIVRGLALRGHDPDFHKYDDLLEHSYGIKMKSQDSSQESIEVVLSKGKKISDINHGEFYQEFELTNHARGRNFFKVKIFENKEQIGEAYIPLSEKEKNSSFKLHFSIDEKNERLELHIDDTLWDKKIEIPMESRYIELSK